MTSPATIGSRVPPEPPLAPAGATTSAHSMAARVSAPRAGRQCCRLTIHQWLLVGSKYRHAPHNSSGKARIFGSRLPAAMHGERRPVVRVLVSLDELTLRARKRVRWPQPIAQPTIHACHQLG